jgi:hypothetical protein
MNAIRWLEEFEHVAARAQGAIEQVKKLVELKRTPSNQFILNIVGRAEQYLRGQQALGRQAGARLGEVDCTGEERRRIHQELETTLQHVRRVALYAQSQVFRLDPDQASSSNPADPTLT